MNCVQFKSDSSCISIRGHLYIASNCVFVWNEVDMVVVALDKIINAYNHPLNGLIFDVE